jgi:uncharacterized protein YabN with tetrapyrrole methylase and pyrophosphatase domain
VEEGERVAEVGDLLFAATNYARKLGIDPEASLREANARFRRRFGRIESAALQKGQSLSDMTLDDLDSLWEAAKGEESQES